MTEQAVSDQLSWSTFQTRLREYVGRRVAAPFVDDLVGDILLRLVQHRGDLQRASNPIAWTYRVAANAIADHYRRRSVEDRGLARLQQERIEPDDPDEAADESASANLAACLLPIIETLPPLYADALRLTDIEGTPQAVAAVRAGISTSGMKSRVQRARRKLQAALYRCCEIQLDARGAVREFAPRPKDTGTSCPTCPPACS